MPVTLNFWKIHYVHYNCNTKVGYDFPFSHMLLLFHIGIFIFQLIIIKICFICCSFPGFVREKQFQTSQWSFNITCFPWWSHSFLKLILKDSVGKSHQFILWPVAGFHYDALVSLHCSILYYYLIFLHVWWWWWIVFVVWLTNERRLVLFPARTIVRDPHHGKSPTLLLNVSPRVLTCISLWTLSVLGPGWSKVVAWDLCLLESKLDCSSTWKNKSPDPDFFLE